MRRVFPPYILERTHVRLPPRPKAQAEAWGYGIADSPFALCGRGYSAKIDGAKVEGVNCSHIRIP